MRKINRIKAILADYSDDCPGTKLNLYRVLTHGKLAGTGRLVILPVDQGFEHGPDKSFSMNPAAYDPEYHYALASESGISAYAAPLGMLAMGADKFARKIPTILKMNSGISLCPDLDPPYQAITSTVRDALRLGCVGIGFTIYPGSPRTLDMMSELSELAREAKSNGLIVVVWSYPRGGDLSKEAETSVDICAYAAHIACMLGAHIIKVKLPTARIELKEEQHIYAKNNIDVSTLAKRVEHIRESCFMGKRLLIFSGGAGKTSEEIYEDARAIRNGGGSGSIIGRNTFQRPRHEALKLLRDLIDIYKHPPVYED